MLKSHFTIAIRRLKRERLYVAINVFGLALGIASFLIVSLYLRSEFTYDKFNSNYSRIYRVIARFSTPGSEGGSFALTQTGIGPLLVSDYPQLGTAVRFRKAAQNVLRYNNIQQDWEVYLADPSAFTAFSHRIIYGDPTRAFEDPFSIAISEKVARRYFGNENPIGKKLQGTLPSAFTVTLVFGELPDNSHLKYDALLPMSLMEVLVPNFSKSYKNTLWSVSVFTYLFVKPDFSESDFSAISAQFADRYMAEQSARTKTTFKADIQRLDKVHFGEKLSGDLPTGNISYAYGLATIAVFILMIACINYVNLSTARATKRAKEVGMRQIIGSTRLQLIVQFLSESLILTSIAFLLALALTAIALSTTPLGSLLGKEHLLSGSIQPEVLAGLIALAVLVAIVSGLYPSLYLSSIPPIAALTQTKRTRRTRISLRQALVLIQLGISIAVIACTSVMMRQMNFIHSTPLGFEKTNRIVVSLRGYDVVRNIKTIKSELLRRPNVLSTATISSVPGTGAFMNVVQTEGADGATQSFESDRLLVGMDFAETMKLGVAEGRSFSKEIATDERESVLVNEAFVKKIGWDTAIGKKIQMGFVSARVIGVVKNFHYASLHNSIGPLILQPIVEAYDNVPMAQRPLLATSIVIELSGNKIRDTFKDVQDVISRFDPQFTFEPVFLEDRLNELYQSEIKLMKLTALFAVICIAICIAGLFGLAAFLTEQRTKEIGIRQVLGSSDVQLVSLLSKQFLFLSLLAAIPASIVSYLAMDAWLRRFAYHVDTSWLLFLWATLIVSTVACITVALQAIKTIRDNPIESLRYE